MRNLQLVISICAISLLFQPSCKADGNELLDECLAAEKFIENENVNHPFRIGMCFGLIQGVRNTMEILKNDVSPRFKACLPEQGIDNGQATRVVVAYLKKNPASLHENEVALTMLAFLDAYPCK